MIRKGNEYETKLLALLLRPHQQQPFADISATILGKCIKPLLQDFVHVRLFIERTILKTKKWKWSKKGTVDKVNRQVRNMIFLDLLVAYIPQLMTLDDISPGDITTVSIRTINTTTTPPLCGSMCRIIFYPP